MIPGAGPMGPFVIPDAVLSVDPSSPTAMHDMAVLLSEVFRIVPITSTPTPRKPTEDASKNPGGLLGKDWPNKTSRDPDTLKRWFADAIPNHKAGALTLGTAMAPLEWYRTVEPDTIGMALHAGMDIVVVDIDYPDKVPADMWPHLETAPFQSSSATDPRRGHYFFRVRDGYYFGQTSAIVSRDGAGSPGELRHGSAIVVTAPTKHPKAAIGRRYQWMRAGEIPEMSDEVAQWLQSEKRTAKWNGAELAVTEATFEDIEAFRDDRIAADHPDLLADHLAFMAGQANTYGLHSSTLGGLIDLLQYAACGLVTGGDAIDGAAKQFVLMRMDPTRGDGSWTPVTATMNEAIAEFEDLLKWAFGKLKAKSEADWAAVHYETLSNAAYWYGYEPPAPLVAPAGYAELPPAAPGSRELYHPREVEDDTGKPLVENSHIHLAEACAERLCVRFQWVTGEDSSAGDWWLYDDAAGVWRRGGSQVNVAHQVRTILREQLAIYEVKDVEDIPRNKTRRKLLADTLITLHGKTHFVYAITNKSWKDYSELNNVINTLKTLPPMWSKVDDFDRSDSRVALGNGVLDIKTGAFESSAAQHKVTKRAPVEFVPGADCPKFKKFLLDCVVKDGDYVNAQLVADTIKRYFGAALLGDWSTDNFMVAHGPAGSGKSTVFEDVPRALLGGESGYWSMITPQVFTRGISEAGRKFELASISGARFLTCNEAFDGASGIESGFLKAFTDGSQQRAAFKGRDNFMMTPGRVVFMSNELPKLSGVDAGISRRAMFIHFPHGHDRSNPLLPDPDEKLFERDLMPELSGILNWMIEGATEYLARGIDAPNSVFKETRESLADSSTMGLFLKHFRPANEDDPMAWQDGTHVLSMKDIQDLYKDFLAMDDHRNGPAVTAKTMAAAIKATYGTVKIDPDKRENFYTDDGVGRRKHVAVRGLMPNADYSAFVVMRGDPVIPGVLAARTRIGIGDVEDWRRKQSAASRPTAGVPLAG